MTRHKGNHSYEWWSVYLIGIFIIRRNIFVFKQGKIYFFLSRYKYKYLMIISIWNVIFVRRPSTRLSHLSPLSSSSSRWAACWPPRIWRCPPPSPSQPSYFHHLRKRGCKYERAWQSDRVTDTEWQCDIVTEWQRDRVIVLPCYRITVWQCDIVTVWQCYKVTVWRCDSVTERQCDRVTVWQCDSVTV